MADWDGSYWYPGSGIYEYWKRYFEEQKKKLSSQPIKHEYERLEDEIEEMQRRRDALGDKIGELTEERNKMNDDIIAMLQLQRLTR